MRITKSQVKVGDIKVKDGKTLVDGNLNMHATAVLSPGHHTDNTLVSRQLLSDTVVKKIISSLYEDEYSFVMNLRRQLELITNIKFQGNELPVKNEIHKLFNLAGERLMELSCLGVDPDMIKNET